MTNYKISLALMAMTMCADAFTVSPVATRSSALLSTSTTNDVFFMDETKPEPPTVAMTESIQPAQPISPKKSVAPPKKAASHGSTGVLAPVVKTVKSVIGEEELNKLRGKVIAMHSDIIKSFVDTSDSPLGQTVLRTMFDVADADKNGTVDEIELGKALKTLGFRFLNEKQIHGIFERADVDKNGYIDMEEWMREAPKTLRTNLVKLAKQNGGDLGLLA